MHTIDVSLSASYIATIIDTPSGNKTIPTISYAVRLVQHTVPRHKSSNYLCIGAFNAQTYNLTAVISDTVPPQQ